MKTNKEITSTNYRQLTPNTKAIIILDHECNYLHGNTSFKQIQDKYNITPYTLSRILMDSKIYPDNQNWLYEIRINEAEAKGTPYIAKDISPNYQSTKVWFCKCITT